MDAVFLSVTSKPLVVIVCNMHFLQLWWHRLVMPCATVTRGSNSWPSLCCFRGSDVEAACRFPWSGKLPRARPSSEEPDDGSARLPWHDVGWSPLIPMVFKNVVGLLLHEHEGHPLCGSRGDSGCPSASMAGIRSFRWAFTLNMGRFRRSWRRKRPSLPCERESRAVCSLVRGTIRENWQAALKTPHDHLSTLW